LTYAELPHGIVDEVILTDDRSADFTAELSRRSRQTSLVSED